MAMAMNRECKIVEEHRIGSSPTIFWGENSLAVSHGIREICNCAIAKDIQHGDGDWPILKNNNENEISL
jgi:hypothetical protein